MKAPKCKLCGHEHWPNAPHQWDGVQPIVRADADADTGRAARAAAAELIPGPVARKSRSAKAPAGQKPAGPTKPNGAEAALKARIAELEAENAALRPDAEAMRALRARNRERMASARSAKEAI